MNETIKQPDVLNDEDTDNVNVVSTIESMTDELNCCFDVPVPDCLLEMFEQTTTFDASYFDNDASYYDKQIELLKTDMMQAAISGDVSKVQSTSEKIQTVQTDKYNAEINKSLVLKNGIKELFANTFLEFKKVVNDDDLLKSLFVGYSFDPEACLFQRKERKGEAKSIKGAGSKKSIPNIKSISNIIVIFSDKSEKHFTKHTDACADVLGANLTHGIDYVHKSMNPLNCVTLCRSYGAKNVVKYTSYYNDGTIEVVDINGKINKA